MWRIRDVYPGYLIRLLFHPGSRIRIKEFKYFNPKKWFLSSRKYDSGCSSRIPDPDPDFLPIPDPGSLILDPGVIKAPDPGSGSATLHLIIIRIIIRLSKKIFRIQRNRILRYGISTVVSEFCGSICRIK